MSFRSLLKAHACCMLLLGWVRNTGLVHHKIICSRHHMVPHYLKVDFIISDTTTVNVQQQNTSALSEVNGLPAGANYFHLSANECLSALFTRHATLLKQLIDHWHPTGGLLWLYSAPPIGSRLECICRPRNPQSQSLIQIFHHGWPA